MPPNISLCMIVKDEEASLATCLDSVKDLVQEMIIVDTGSKDNTKQIARAYGATIVDFPWNSNFSEARNVSLEHAHGDWILVVDADQVLEVQDHDQIRKLLSQYPPEIGFLVKIKNVIESRETREHFEVRIYPRKPNIRYRGMVHEQIVRHVVEPNGALSIVSLDTIQTSITIFHGGYSKDSLRRKQKLSRNKMILEKELSQNPHDAFHFMNLGVMYEIEKKYEKALQLFKQGKQVADPRSSYYPLLLIAGARSLIALGKGTEALDWIEEAVVLAPGISDGHYVLGQAYEATEQHRKAIHAYENAIRCNSVGNSTIVHDPSTKTWKPHHRVGVCLLKIGEVSFSLPVFEKALEFDPENILVSLDLGEAFLKHYGADEGEKCLQQKMHHAFDSGFWGLIGFYRTQKKFDQIFLLAEQELLNKQRRLELWEKVGYVFAEEKEFAHAKKVFEIAVFRLHNSTLLNDLGSVLIQLNEIEKAIPLLKQALAENEDHLEAKVNLGLAYQSTKQHQEMCELLKDYPLGESHADLAMFLLGTTFLNLNQPDQAKEAYLKALSLDPEMEESKAGLAAAELMIKLGSLGTHPSTSG